MSLNVTKTPDSKSGGNQEVTGKMRLIDNKASLSPRQERAASLVADDTLSDEQIAAETGITKRTLERWKQKPAFAARIEEIRRAVKRTLADKGIAALVERHRLM
jgi:hypothetical protein